MKVRMIKTGETVNANDSYALRLIEQGKAVAVPGKKRNPASASGSPTLSAADTTASSERKPEPSKAVMADGTEGQDS